MIGKIFDRKVQNDREVLRNQMMAKVFTLHIHPLRARAYSHVHLCAMHLTNAKDVKSVRAYGSCAGGCCWLLPALEATSRASASGDCHAYVVI